jgi:hypothetical protein
VTSSRPGALVPEALAAADEVDARVVCLTSPDLVFRALQARRGLREGDDAILTTLFRGRCRCSRSSTATRTRSGSSPASTACR